jgi:protoporphyrinogen oxidase
MFGLKKEGESIKSYYSRIVGKRNYEKVFGPAFTAVISQNADDFPADLLFKKRPRRKDVLKSFTFTNGLQTITDAIAAEKGVEVKTGSEVQAITFRDGIFEVSVSGGERIEAKSLALASPPDVAAKLLRPSFPEVAGVLSEIGVESIETVGVAIRKNALSLSPLAGLIAVEDAFYSAVSRDTVPHGSYRGFSFHFKAGGTDEASKLRRMSEILKVERGLLEQVASRESVLPSLRVNHPALVDRIDRVVAGKKLLLTGNYFLGLAIEDCVSRSLSEFARLKTLL